MSKNKLILWSSSLGVTAGVAVLGLMAPMNVMNTSAKGVPTSEYADKNENGNVKHLIAGTDELTSDQQATDAPKYNPSNLTRAVPAEQSNVWVKDDNGKMYWHNYYGDLMPNAFVGGPDLKVYWTNADGSMFMGTGKQRVTSLGATFDVYFNDDHTVDLNLTNFAKDYVAKVNEHQKGNTMTIVQGTDIHYDRWKNIIEATDPLTFPAENGKNIKYLSRSHWSGTNAGYYYMYSRLFALKRQEVMHKIEHQYDKLPLMNVETGDLEDGIDVSGEESLAGLQDIVVAFEDTTGEGTPIPSHAVPGNHDHNYYGVHGSGEMSDGARRNDIIVTPSKKTDGFDASYTKSYDAKHGYYSIKDSKNKMYSIYLNSFDNDYAKIDIGGYSANEVKWLDEQLHQVPDDYHVMFYSHDSFPTNVNKVPGANSDVWYTDNLNPDVVAGMIKAFQSGTSYDLTSNLKNRFVEGKSLANCIPDYQVTVKGDFSNNAKNRVLGYIFGHVHHDTQMQYDDPNNKLGINFISNFNQFQYGQKLGTPQNNIFTTYTFNWDNNTMYADGFGNASRSLKFPTIKQIYPNNPAVTDELDGYTFDSYAVNSEGNYVAKYTKDGQPDKYVYWTTGTDNQVTANNNQLDLTSASQITDVLYKKHIKGTDSTGKVVYEADKLLPSNTAVKAPEIKGYTIKGDNAMTTDAQDGQELVFQYEKQADDSTTKPGTGEDNTDNKGDDSSNKGDDSSNKGDDNTGNTSKHDDSSKGSGASDKGDTAKGSGTSTKGTTDKHDPKASNNAKVTGTSTKGHTSSPTQAGRGTTNKGNTSKTKDDAKSSDSLPATGTQETGSLIAMMSAIVLLVATSVRHLFRRDTTK